MHTNGKHGRLHLDTNLKHLMKVCLQQTNHYTIELTDDVLKNSFSFADIRFTHQFKMPKKIKSRDINANDYSTARISGNVIGAIEMFAISCSTILHESDHEGKTKPNHIDPIAVDDNIHPSEIDDETYEVRSSLPFFINEDGSEVITSPVRACKRRRNLNDRPGTPYNPLRSPCKSFGKDIFEDDGIRTPISTPNFISRASSLSFSPSFSL
jgi:hypothetical protein